MNQLGKILIVDDEAGTLRVLASVLEDVGYRVETASDGRIALEMLEASDFDLVLLDFLMPQLDGCATLEAIRKSDTFADVRVVMMSGVAESMVRRRCRASFEAFLYKPFSLDELFATVRGPTKPKKARKPPAKPVKRRTNTR
jgi:CheY-like chemotaxis protein